MQRVLQMEGRETSPGFSSVWDEATETEFTNSVLVQRHSLHDDIVCVCVNDISRKKVI